MGVSGQQHPSTVLPPGITTSFSLYMRPGGPQDQSGRVQKIPPQPEFEPQTVQPVASSYIDCAIRTQTLGSNPQLAL
jgi:hypothetical protein